VPRFSVSPDGKLVAFEARTGEGKPYQLWIRRLDSNDAQPLVTAPPASSNALQGFFWSPDSRHLGFFDEPAAKMKKIDVQGGTPQSLLDVSGNQYSGTWNTDGVILFSSTTTNGVQRISANGGVPSPATTIARTQSGTRHLWPQFLPDGRHFLFQTQAGAPETWTVNVGSIDSPDTKMVLQSEFSATFVAPDFLLFMRGNSLFAQHLDLNTFALTGDPSLLAESVSGTPNGRPGFGVSNTGVLVYAKGSESGGSAGSRQLEWIDRSGRRTVLGPPVNALVLRLSPDGKRLAYSDSTGGGSPTDIWIADIERGVRTRLTNDPAADDFPVWSPDGSRVIFGSMRGGVAGIYEKPSNGTMPEQLIYQAPPGYLVAPVDWSRDGQTVFFTQGRDNGSRDVWVLPRNGDGKPHAFLSTPFDEAQAALSPNGRWVTYVSRESGGTVQVIVQSFPNPTVGRLQISTDGGIRPRWRPDGKELYYQDASSRIIAVPVAADSTFQVGKSSELFQVTLGFGSPPVAFPYDIAPDGRRFVLSEPIAAGVGPVPDNPNPLSVILNWTSLITN
jgi:Tol biopolymer transport system component